MVEVADYWKYDPAIIAKSGDCQKITNCRNRAAQQLLKHVLYALQRFISY